MDYLRYLELDPEYQKELKERKAILEKTLERTKETYKQIQNGSELPFDNELDNEWFKKKICKSIVSISEEILDLEKSIVKNRKVNS